MDDSVVKKVIINFLHYVNKKSIEEATILYNNNKREFGIVIDILGVEFVVGLLESVVVKRTSKTKRKKGNGE